MPRVTGLALCCKILFGASRTNLADVPFVPATAAPQIKVARTVNEVAAHGTVCARVVAVLVGLEVGRFQLAAAPAHSDLGTALLV